MKRRRNSMGCWSETCAISNLPISAGELTYLIILTKNPFKDKDGKTGCYYNDHWFLRALPILGEYDDYGRIENWEENWIHDLILEQFKLDLISEEQNEQGSTRGVPPLNVGNLTFANLIDWFKEGKVKVRSGVGIGRSELPTVACLVRKDVWDTLLQMSWADWQSMHSMQKMEEDIKKYMPLYQEAYKKASSSKHSLGVCFEFDDLVSNTWFDNSFITRFRAYPKPGPTRYGSYEFFKKWVDDKLVKNEITEEEAFRKYLKIGEVVHVESMLGILRKSWHPTTGTGSQDQDWEQNLKFNLNIAKIAFREEMSGLADNNGFSKDDFKKTTEKTLLSDMKEVYRRRNKLEENIQKFVKDLDEITLKIEKNTEG